MQLVLHSSRLHVQNPPPDFACADFVERRINVLQWRPVRDQLVKIQFAALIQAKVARDIFGWISVPTFATHQDFAEMQRQGVDSDILIETRYTGPMCLTLVTG